MNEVDEDNNIVGGVPFYNVSFPDKKTPLTQKVAYVLKVILMLVIIAGLIGGIVWVYRKYGSKIKSVKIPKVVKPQNSAPTFSLFNDEESATST